MRLKAISLSWFRGAATEVALGCDGKSVVVYGSNGAGKSSFVDGLEYAINGKISHLSHEYSGRRQERGIQNTHCDTSSTTLIRITFQDDTEREIELAKDGGAKSKGSEFPPLSSWDCKRTILRQDEVSQFISDTKGNKYSAVLPLLGLSELETAAENLRQLSKATEEAGKLQELITLSRQVDELRKTQFLGESDRTISAKIASIFVQYLPNEPVPPAFADQAVKIGSTIDRQLESLSPELREHVVLCDIAYLQVKALTQVVRNLNTQYREMLEPLMEERLAVLEQANLYTLALPDGDTAVCPACGLTLSRASFVAHVEAERTRLATVISLRLERNRQVNLLADALAVFQGSAKKSDLDAWCTRAASRTPRRALLVGLDLTKFRADCSADVLDLAVDELIPLYEEAAASARTAPASAKQLTTDRKTLYHAKLVLDGKAHADALVRIESIVAYVKGLEQHVRDQIKQRAAEVIADISADVQSMWSMLHPGRPIADAALFMPSDADKAIDIRLKFHGVAQDSPRLTLSEGYRNSLGLCIFLAMAKRESHSDRPLVLDDVIVSLDRHHRGLLVDVLKKEFGHRQVIILTHDREWYTELRHLLNGPEWQFRTLLPFESPELGIRWSHRTSSFADARSMLATRPDAAGNDARKIMDVELALIAERLQVRFPFVRGEKNDMRMAHDLLARISSDAKKCFQFGEGDPRPPFDAAFNAFDSASRALSAWANRSSHTFNVEAAEASKLLDACEAALEVFKCSKCGKNVWYAEAGRTEAMQCECSYLRWRYGKA